MNTLSYEYSKSNRGRCRVCDEYFKKMEVKFRLKEQIGKFSHLRCLLLNYPMITCDAIVGFKNIKDADKKSIMDVLKKSNIQENGEVEKKRKKEDVKYLMGFGEEVGGELGFGRPTTKPIKLPLDEDCLMKTIKYVVAGAIHSAFCNESGELYTFGVNDEKALGRDTVGDPDSECVPKKVKLSEKVSKVSAGDSHTAVLTTTKKIYLWGNFRDQNGRIGIDPSSTESIVEPKKLALKIKIKELSSGTNHLLLLTEKGEVYSLGVGEQGQLGRLSADEAKFEKNNSGKFLKPTKVAFPDNAEIVQIHAGHYSSFALSSCRTLYAWGLNNYSQLGIPNESNTEVIIYFPAIVPSFTEEKLLKISAGQHHSLALDSAGRAYSVGRHEYGRLGQGKIGKDEKRFRMIEKLEEIVDISAGATSSFAVDKHGKLFSWGMEAMNLGIGKEEDIFEPTLVAPKTMLSRKVLNVTAGSGHTLILVEDSG